MIASLKGSIQDRSLDRVVVEVGGIGYRVIVSMQTLADLPGVGEEVGIRCYTYVREDALQLYGFLEEAEQKAFELLIIVSGIGPKLAMTILSGMSVHDLLSAIAAADHARLQTIPGVGKKTAERMTVELRDRCAKLNLKSGSTPASPRGTTTEVADVVEALVNLGYKRAKAEKVVERVHDGAEETLMPEQLLRAALIGMTE